MNAVGGESFWNQPTLVLYNQMHDDLGIGINLSMTLHNLVIEFATEEGRAQLMVPLDKLVEAMGEMSNKHGN